jgi:hypothetical protein
MAWHELRERGSGRKSEHITKLMHKAKDILDELCEEFEDMEEYFGEREEYDREDDFRERRCRNGRYMR